MVQYYVNPVSGNDTYNGTQESAPFKTITRALQQVRTGDRIQLAPGTYSHAASKDAGFTSAQSIAGMGREAFAENYSTSLGDRENALTIHTAATEKSALAHTLWSKYACCPHCRSVYSTFQGYIESLLFVNYVSSLSVNFLP